MPVQAETFVDASPGETYESTRDLLHGHIESGAFKVLEDDPAREWGIFWKGPIASSRYLFVFRGQDGGTQVEATLWLGGVLGPVHNLLRRRGNRTHIEKILRDLKALAESDDELDEEDLDDEGAAVDAVETPPDG